MRRLQPIILAAAMSAALAAGAPAQEAGPVLTLDDAIRLALQKNKNLKVTSYDRGISRANLLAARGQFDPALVMSRTFSETDFNTSLGLIPVVDNTKVDYYSAGLQGVLPLGTRYTVYGSTQEVRDVYSGIARNYQTFGGFQVTQPLLKGFGFDANLVQVRIARANRSISDCEYRQEAIAVVTNVVSAYSNLQYAHDALDIARRSRERAASLVADNEKMSKVGNIAQSDVTLSRYTVAAQEESVLIYERSVRDAENSLRELIGEEMFFEDKPLFTLVPVAPPNVEVDRRADLARALQMRPDYQAARLGIVQYRATEAAARNGLLPEVDFTGGYGYNGSAYTFSASKQMVEDHQNPSVSAGLSVTIPLTFAVGRGNLRAARLQRAKAEEDLKRFEADIAIQVAQAEGQIETTRKRVAVDHAELALANQALEAEEKKKRAGVGSTLAVYQVQLYVAQAEIALSSALADERQSVATFDQQLGTTLERHNIKLAED
jgi:outer membrane protein TolC